MRPLFRHLLPLIILLLIACGGPQQSAAPTAAPIASTAAQTTTVAATATGTSLFATIPQSQTPEGYHVLGNPQAPVTLVMYSDFL